MSRCSWMARACRQVAPVNEIAVSTMALQASPGVDVDASPSSPATRHLEHPDHRPVRAR